MSPLVRFTTRYDSRYARTATAGAEARSTFGSADQRNRNSFNSWGQLGNKPAGPAIELSDDVGFESVGWPQAQAKSVTIVRKRALRNIRRLANDISVRAIVGIQRSSDSTSKVIEILAEIVLIFEIPLIACVTCRDL